MRTVLMLALFFTCLPAASAADDPITKRNNDASTPGLIKSPPMRLVPHPSRPVVEPAPGGSGPTK